MVETAPAEASRRPEGHGTAWWGYWPILLAAVPVGLSSGYVAHAKNKASRIAPSDLRTLRDSGRARLAAQDEERARTLAGLRAEIARLRRGIQAGDIQALFDLLEHAFWEIREGSAKALLDGVTDADDPGGAKARREILRSPPVLVRLIRGLRLPDPAVRETLCRICGILMEPETRSALEHVAKEDRVKAVRDAAEEALRRLR